MNALALVVAFQLGAGIPDEVDVRRGVAGATVGAAAGGVGAGLAFHALVQAGAKASKCEGAGCEGFGLMSIFYTVPVALLGAGIGGVGGALLGIAIGDALDAE